ncbi:2-amino-4-hydroxy-6-hydroxymethyldihydropteridine diphosphokinase [candidate division WOR-1 bacterium RIFCSPLOWO2_12_FULL_45_9]|uniref:2-amino-4-hydroxy-6-hydroxymethyldihydropteridine diphosphokinase n=2 Tax=Saganbacteria TaxID=1703751 RepID=A0A1F4RKY1_UNCSA|nr:MAG: 2-amino-4-hydroxy-6-hydroxymethyldihydropteridine diphosphokinase [candidate division WOR-1 bacterium RIFCSPLOWO2_12_FULL_45_9]
MKMIKNKKKKILSRKKKVVLKKKKVAGPKVNKLNKRKPSINIAYLGLGSNVGDREEYIEQAVFLIGKHPKLEVARHSTNYETEAEGGGGSQPPFINAVVEVRTKLSPHELLDACHEIEATLGREREIEWGPRTIDIDILLYNDEVISDDKLQIPHPLMHERVFVLKPLRELASQVMHPILEKSIQSLYEERKTELGEKYDDELPGFKEIKGGTYDDYERW